MALYRDIKVHENSRMWAFVEWSDEDPQHFVLLGGKEFPTKQEAEDFSKGFAVGSYDWKEPSSIKISRLQKEEYRLQERLREIESELYDLGGKRY